MYEMYNNIARAKVVVVVFDFVVIASNVADNFNNIESDIYICMYVQTVGLEVYIY